MPSGIQFQPTSQLSLTLQRRAEKRLQDMTDDEIYAYLADTIYTEKKRLNKSGDDGSTDYIRALNNASKAIRRDRANMRHSLMGIIDI